MKSRPWLAVAMILFAAPSFSQSVVDPNLEVNVVPTSGLQLPTGMRFLTDGSIFVTELQSGRVKRVSNGVTTQVLDLPVNTESERGLLGIALDPNFSANGYTYLYYSAATTDGGAWQGNRVSRFTWNGTSLGAETPLLSFDPIPSGGNGPNHNGGVLTFGPDGKLYGITGDLNRSFAEQNNQAQAGVSSGVGGIFRINTDGSIPADNPFAGNPNPDFHKWYAYGIRNSFGLSFDPVTGQLWDTENGPNSYDEINKVNAGFNSGWSQIMGPDSRDPQGVGNLVALPGSTYSDPEFSFLSPTAVTSIKFVAGSAWGPSYDNALLLGDNNTQDLYLFRLNTARDAFVLSGALADLVADSTAERNSLLFGQDFGVVTDIRVGPDRNVYVLSLSNGAIYQIAPVPEAGTLALVAAGGGAIAMMIRRRGRAAAHQRIVS